MLPFIPLYACRDCRKRFFRGRKPPFATCPTCRSRWLEAIPSASSAGLFRKFARSVSGAHDYACLCCGLEFLDSRPLHSELDEPSQNCNSAA
jgi:DNA-directed RNA polymerase subunit RPC12/RpoP